MSSIKPYLSARPLDDADLEIAVAALFGTGRAQELTAEQKAAQEAKLAPYLVSSPAPRPTLFPSPSSDRRSEGARRGRLKVLARNAAEQAQS
jgi:hypothetical protein